jgi:DNA-binding GntR family transcriptional regulator
MLGQEGLVTIKPRSGYFITRVTLKQLRDMLELREILELASIERAVDRITEEQLEQLKQVHTGYTDEEDESYIRYMSENRTFHCLIAEATGNLELTEALGRLHDRLLRFMILCRVGATLECRHSRVIEALRTREIEAARQTILAEINETSETILQCVIDEEGAYWYLGKRGSAIEASRKKRKR